MLRSSMVVGFFSLLSGISGILVETSIAAYLGLSRSSDTFYVAYTIPYAIANLLSATAQFSLVPFFAALEARHSLEDQWKGFSYAVNLTFVGLSAVALLGAAVAHWVILGIAPGFTAAQTELSTQLCRWLLLVIIPAGIAEIFRSFLFSQQRFVLSSGAGFFRNIVVILSVIFLFRRYGLYSIVLGYFGGYFLQLAVLGGQVLVTSQVRYTLTFRGSSSAFRNLRGSGAYQLGGALAWQIVTVVERIIASFLAPGTLTALNYGFKILTTMAELLAGSVGTASLPALSRAVARSAQAEERRTFANTLHIGFALVLPVMVFCLMLDRNIMRLVFQRGNFTAEATALMSKVFFCYCLSLVFYSFIRVFTFYLFARNEAAAFFRLSLFLYASTIAFDLLYVGVLRLGARGIPLGLLTSSFLTCVLVYQRNLAAWREVLDRELAVFAAKNCVGAALAGIAVWALRIWVRTPSSAWENFLYLCLLCTAGAVTYASALVASGAFTISQVALMWRQPRDS